MLVLERELQPGVHIANPRRVLVPFRNVPRPVKCVGTITAFLSKPHHVFGGVGFHRDLERDVVNRGTRCRAQRNRVLDRAVKLECCVTVQTQCACRLSGVPRDSASGALCDYRRSAGKCERAAFRVAYHETRRRREHVS